MNKAEKKERRQLRQKLQAAAFNDIPIDVRLTSTIAQQRSIARSVADQILAGKNPGLAEPMPERAERVVEAQFD